MSTGEVIASNDLIDLVTKSRNFKKLINSLPKKYNQGFVEAVSISGAFKQPIEISEKALIEISSRLTKKYSDIDADW